MAFLSVGRPEDEGCFCSVQTMLRECIELLSNHFELTFIDAEAGIEQVNRNVMSRVDTLILVADVSAKALRVAETIHQLALEVIGDVKTGLVLNKVRNEEEVERILKRTALPMIGWVPEDDMVRQYDAEELPFYDLPDCTATESVIRAMARLGL